MIFGPAGFCPACSKRNNGAALWKAWAPALAPCDCVAFAEAVLCYRRTEMLVNQNEFSQLLMLCHFRPESWQRKTSALDGRGRIIGISGSLNSTVVR